MLALFLQGTWKSSKCKNFEIGFKLPSPYFAETLKDNNIEKSDSAKSIITGIDVSVPLFFRLHFIVRGKFFLSGSKNSCSVFAETSFSQKEKTAQLALDFPMSGFFQGNYFCRMCDIFGLFSFPVGVLQQEKLPVRSAPFLGEKMYVNTLSGAEDNHNKISTSEERYYMREYAPGDRMRDINWKSSEKLDMFVTRISPDNQEKVSRIEIYFRNYGPAGITSLQALWVLDRAKAMLSHFLRSIHANHFSYVINIYSAQSNWEIKNFDELEMFLDELAVLSFSSLKNETINLAAHEKGSMYVFSTVYDTELKDFLAAYNARSVSLFFVRTIFFRQREINKKSNSEIFLIRNFFLKNYRISPFQILRKTHNQQILSAGAIASVLTNKTEIIYAETKL
jgi:hypothetical protein